MTSFNNIILDNIYKKFLNNEESENKEKIKKLARRKYIPFINTFWMWKDEDEALSFLGYNVFTFAIFSALILLLFSHQDQVEDKILSYFFMAGCFGFWFISFFSSIFKNERKIEFLNNYRFRVPLSKEDFKTVMSNFNNDIVEKIMKENNGELCYKDLKNLDDLLLKQEEVLAKDQEDKIISIWQKISRNDILARFKQKSEEEIIEELDHMGFAVPEGKTIVEMEKFYRSLKEKKKEENIL